MIVFRFLPPIPQQGYLLRQLGIIAHNRPRFTIRTEVFAGIEAKASGITD
jgi:hypothetical protein